MRLCRIKSKYVEMLVASVCLSQVKLLFSDSQENTSDIIAHIADVERRKGKAFVRRPPKSEDQLRVS